jgi:selenide,water dikinase
LPPPTDTNLVSGLKEDAAVYRLSPSLAVVQTVDFITPVLNDPYAFGAVAAANAISDIYAMGAKPVYALNIVEFPVKSLPLSILEEILKGGADKALEAGVSIAGGHSVEDNAPKYGMAVTGLVDPTKLVRKKGANPGDVLFLTKPLGTGILTTAIDRGLAGAETEQEIYHIMAYLNKGAAEAMLAIGVNACTDVTGFGLLGHLAEMLTAGNVSAKINFNKTPLIAGVRSMAKAGAIPAGTHNNYRYLRDKVNWKAGIFQEEVMLLCDAQTAGGLLIAVAEEKAGRLQAALAKADCLVAAEIGVVTKQKEKVIEVLS